MAKELQEANRLLKELKEMQLKGAVQDRARKAAYNELSEIVNEMSKKYQRSAEKFSRDEQLSIEVVRKSLITLKKMNTHG